MDQIKIGRYIAEKKKQLGLTQLQLAEKLGMSNKSVSKWERGVCLPDVSVYMKLCDILGITLNEFLAGEDLSTVEIIPRSEETIIGIAKDEKIRKKKAKHIISVLLLLVLVVSGIAIYFLHKDGVFYRNCVVPLSWQSEEGKAVNLVWDEGANLYRYYADKDYNQLQIKYYRYKKERLIEEGVLKSYTFSGGYKGEGMIAIINDFDSGDLLVKLNAEGDDFQYGGDETVLTEYKLPLEGMNLDDWQALYGVAVQIPQKTVHLEEDEAGLLYLVYDKEMSSSIPESIEKDGFWPKGKEKCQGIDANDYTDFITIKFNHVE